MINSLDVKSRGLNVIVKLDMHKAFDRVSWPFFTGYPDEILLLDQFVNLVMDFLASTRLSILVNGISCGFIQSNQGVKQGYPMSLYLFILVSEALS